MRHKNNCHAGLLPDVLEQVQILCLNGHIEVGRGLVGIDQPGAASQGNSADNTLTHTAAHLVRIIAHAQCWRGDATAAEISAPAVVKSVPGCPVLGRLRDLRVDAEERVERGHGIP